MPEFETVRELFETAQTGSQQEKDQIDYVELQGWVRTNRNNGSVGFIELNDGTYFKNAQVVYTLDTKGFQDIAKYGTGCAITVVGKFELTPEARQPFEIKATEVILEGACDQDYPLQKKRHGFEFLREIAHLRPRTNTFSAVFRVRSVLAMAIHEFFQSQGFIYVHAPIITGNDAEGAGEAFVVTTRKDAKYEEDFFGKILSGNEEKLPSVAIYYNSSDINSSMAFEYTISVLNGIKDSMNPVFTINNLEGETYDLAGDSDMVGSMIGMVLPFLLVVLLFSGAMAVCSDAIAGEKERGTIATLLVTPVKRSNLVVGKILALGLTTIVSATSSFLGIILSLPKLVGSEFSFETFSVTTLALVFLVVVITSLLFTSILTIISTYSKSVKEANGIAAPLMMLISVVGITGMFTSSGSDNLLMYLIPVYNSIQCFSGILNLSFNTAAFMITIGANILYIALCIAIVTKMFNSEKVMFNK